MLEKCEVGVYKSRMLPLRAFEASNPTVLKNAA